MCLHVNVSLGSQITRPCVLLLFCVVTRVLAIEADISLRGGKVAYTVK